MSLLVIAVKTTLDIEHGRSFRTRGLPALLREEVVVWQPVLRGYSSGSIIIIMVSQRMDSDIVIRTSAGQYVVDAGETSTVAS